MRKPTANNAFNSGVRRTRLHVIGEGVCWHLERQLGRAGRPRWQRRGLEEATHEPDGFHGAVHEGLHLCEPRGREDCGAIAQVAHAEADVHLESTGGKTNGRPQRG